MRDTKTYIDGFIIFRPVTAFLLDIQFDPLTANDKKIAKIIHKEVDIKNATFIKTFITNKGKGFQKVDQKLKYRVS